MGDRAPIWLYEVRAVLARAHLKAAVPETEIADFLQDLEAFPIEVDAVHRIAIAYRLTSYDAADLELAM